jgi:hypothetical protein
MDEDELRDLQDPSAWDYENAEVVAPMPEAGAVVAVRFAADEFARVVKQAAEANLTLAAFVRGAVIEKVARRSGW